jgi:hypothetical protein
MMKFSFTSHNFDTFTLKMEARGSPEAFVLISQTARQYFPEDVDLNADCCEDFALTTFNDYGVTQPSVSFV